MRDDETLIRPSQRRLGFLIYGGYPKTGPHSGLIEGKGRFREMCPVVAKEKEHLRPHDN